MAKTPGDKWPTLCQGKMHPWGERPPAALATYDLKWTVIDSDGEPGGQETAVRRLCPECKARHEAHGVQVTPHRFD
jgi:hypothetical protein